MAADTKNSGQSLSLAGKIAAIIGELGKIHPEGVNQQSHYTFVGYDQLNGVLAPLLAKYRVVIIPSFEDIREESFSTQTDRGAKLWTRSVVTGTATIIDAADPRDRFVASIAGAAQDVGGKSAAQAQTEAVKRFLLKLFFVSTTDDVDPDSQTVNNVPKTGFSPCSGQKFDSGNHGSSDKTCPHGNDSGGKSGCISGPQAKRIFAIGRSHGADTQTIKKILGEMGIEDPATIRKADYEWVVSDFETRASSITGAQVSVNDDDIPF